MTPSSFNRWVFLIRISVPTQTPCITKKHVTSQVGGYCPSLQDNKNKPHSLFLTLEMSQKRQERRPISVELSVQIFFAREGTL